MKYSASCYSGCGNDFLIIDDKNKVLRRILDEGAIQTLCGKNGTSTDGLILVSPSTHADFRMTYFNRDGKEASMCGNGIRCLFRFAIDKLGYKKDRALIQTKERIIEVRDFGDNRVSVKMGKVIENGFNIEIPFQAKNWIFHSVNTGVPHIISFVNNLNDININLKGSFFRNHELFSPHGTNVNFVEINNESSGPHAYIRTFERGVEAETLACGTGCTAAAYVMSKIYGLEGPISLQVRSGEHLEISFKKTLNEVDDLEMCGKACWLRDAHLIIEEHKPELSLQWV